MSLLMFASSGCSDDSAAKNGGQTDVLGDASSSSSGGDASSSSSGGDASSSGGDASSSSSGGDASSSGADASSSSSGGDTSSSGADMSGDASVCEAESVCGGSCCSTDEVCRNTVCVPICVDGAPCQGSFLCRHGACVPNLGACTDNDGCPGDAYCSEDNECLPYGVPVEMQNDTECVRGEPLDGVVPVMQCEWVGPAAGDPTEGSSNIYTAPIVADLNLDLDPGRLQPSIIVTTWETVGGVRTGTLRVFDGRTCEEQMHIGGDDDADEANRPAYGTQWAAGDLDGDVPTGGHPEIVGLHRTSTTDNTAPLQLFAFRVDASGAQPALERMWYGRDCGTGTLIEFASNSANYGPGLWDLDDDGVPEILIDSMVFGADGCLLSTFEDFDYITHNRMNTIADVDADGVPELVMADRLAQWDSVANDWVNEAYFVTDATAHKQGHVAIADLWYADAQPAARGHHRLGRDPELRPQHQRDDPGASARRDRDLGASAALLHRAGDRGGSWWRPDRERLRRRWSDRVRRGREPVLQRLRPRL